MSGNLGITRRLSGGLMVGMELNSSASMLISCFDSWCCGTATPKEKVLKIIHSGHQIC